MTGAVRPLDLRRQCTSRVGTCKCRQKTEWRSDRPKIPAWAAACRCLRGKGLPEGNLPPRQSGGLGTCLSLQFRTMPNRQESQTHLCSPNIAGPQSRRRTFRPRNLRTAGSRYDFETAQAHKLHMPLHQWCPTQTRPRSACSWSSHSHRNIGRECTEGMCLPLSRSDMILGGNPGTWWSQIVLKTSR